MRKLIIKLAVILFILLPSSLIISCQQRSLTPWSPVENEDGWTIFTNSKKVYALLAEGNALWAATSGGVVRWDVDKGTYRKYTTLDSLADNDVRSIGRDNQGNLWFGTLGGVSRYNPTKSR